jgi:hypothetical protein
MLKDRGSIKWTTLMLPEHVKALREWDYHERHDEVKPNLDEDQLVEMDFILQKALHDNLRVLIRFYNNKHKQKEHIVGHVSLIYYQKDRIEVTSNETKRIIKIEDIFDATLT